MSRKLIYVIAILGIMLMSLSILGCQGYQAPKYKSPSDTEEDDLEEVEIDVSDLDEEDDFWDDEEDLVDEEDDIFDDEEDDTTTTTPTPTSSAVKSYKPAATTVEDDEEDEGDFTKSPYRSVVEENLPTLTVTEGELVKLTVKATDADGDKLEYDFGSPLNSEGKWQTRSGDAGVYYPEIKVSDGKETVTKKIKVVVEPKNNKPVLQFIPNIDVDEGDTVVLNPRATDADGDKLTYAYTGWMTKATKVTDYTDAGVHKVTVSVTDGISTVSQEVTVTVDDVNRAPTVEIEF
jgi:hypothetical protein